MSGWPKRDADIILYFEIILMSLFLSMNSTDLLLQNLESPNYLKARSFPISRFLTPLFNSFHKILIIFEELLVATYYRNINIS